MPIIPKNKRKACRIKKDYQRKNLENPFFKNRYSAHHKKSGFGWKAYVLIFCFCIFSVIYVFFASPLFEIKNVKIKGLGRLPETAISERIWNQASKGTFWPSRRYNIFLFDREEAAAELIDSFNFSKVDIDKKLFHTISISIEERPYAFIWQEAGKSYYSDSQGYLIKDNEVKPEDLLLFPLIVNQSGRELAANDYLDIDPDYLVFIFSLKTEVEKNGELSIESFIIDQEFKTVKVKFRDGLLAYFNTKEEALKQLEKLLIVKKEKIKDNLSVVNYLDLRYGDKVYIGNK